MPAKILKFKRKKTQIEVEQEVQQAIDDAVKILREEFDRDKILKELENEDKTD